MKGGQGNAETSTAAWPSAWCAEVVEAQGTKGTERRLMGQREKVRGAAAGLERKGAQPPRPAGQGSAQK